MARIVLVADDSPTIQKRAMGILKADGYEVETVSNGVAAIKRLAVVRPAVIIADVCMPGRDGYEVCEHVKKTPEFSHIRVVLLISDMEPYDSAKGTAVKADGILKKPFEGRELISLVDKLADESEAAASAVEEVSIAPPAAAAPALEEFEVSSEPDSTPTILQSPEPDFSAHASGVAFAESVSEDAPAFPLEHHADIGNFPFGTQEAAGPSLHGNDFEFPTLQAEEPSLRESAQAGPVLDEPAISAPSTEEPSAFLDSLRGSPEHPVFLEESHAPAAEASAAALRTAIFRTPIEIADPIWKEEAPLEAKDGTAAGLEPQFIAEDLDVSALGAHAHPHPHDHEHLHDDAAEPMHDHVHEVNATNLGSFSLDAAAAGQVRFNAELPEVVYADELAEASALAAPASEPAPEASALPEVVYADASSEEVALEAPAELAAPELSSSEPVIDAAEPAALESPSIEPVADAVEPHAAIGAPLEVVYSHDDAPVETVAEEIHEEAAAPEPEALTGEAEVVVGSVAEESETAPTESRHEEPVPEATAESGAAEIHPEEIAQVATADSAPADPEEKSVPEPVAAAVAVPEPIAPEVAVQQHPPVEDSKPQEAPEPAAMAPAPTPKPAVDHELVLSIVRKVVAHMAPSFLGDEAKADMAKRLAEKITTELNPETPPE